MIFMYMIAISRSVRMFAAHAEGQVFQSKLGQTSVKTRSHSFNIKSSAYRVNILDLEK